MTDTLSPLDHGDRLVRDAIRRAERERDLDDACAKHSAATGDRLAELEFTASASGWQMQIDALEERL